MKSFVSFNFKHCSKNFEEISFNKCYRQGMRNINVMVFGRALEVEMLELCGLDYKITYYPFISEWKPFENDFLQEHRARDEADPK